MTKILDLNKRRPASKETLKLWNFSRSLDQLVVSELEAGELNPRDLAGVMAHRLGSLLRCFENREALLDVCLDIILRQANTDLGKKDKE